MHKIKLEGIVLKTWSYSESDLIVSFLTRERGKIRAIAKGAKSSKKRFGGSLDLCCHSFILLGEKKHQELLFLEEASPVSGFLKIRQDYDAILTALGMVDFCEHFCREEGGVFFEVLFSCLSRLSELGPASFFYPEIYLHFILKNLEALGLLPQVESCVRCRAFGVEEAYFDTEAGGIVCGQCFVKPKNSLFTLQMRESFLELLRAPQFEKNRDAQNARFWFGLAELLEEHLLYQTGQRLEWRRFLNPELTI